MQENNEDKYVLRLYISGSTALSNRTINNLRKICIIILKAVVD